MVDTKAPVQKDPITNAIGQFGKYQWFLCFFIFLSKFPTSFNLMAIIFLAPKIHYSCPPAGNDTCPCTNPIYDTSTFTRTMTTEWDLICDKKWMISFTQTAFQFGTLTGSIVFGMLSDRFGRKKPLLATIVIILFFGVIITYVRIYWIFVFIRYILGVAVGGNIVTTFVIVMEFVGTKYREIVSALIHAPFNMGHMLLPVLAYIFRDYTEFQLSIALPTVVLLSYFCVVPETPRWLLAKNRTTEAIHILEKIAKVNGLPTENIKGDIEKYQNTIRSDFKRGSIVDLFRTPNIRKNIMAISFNWLACSYCFYGLSEYVGQLSGNVFFNVAISATVALFGTLVSIPLMHMVGRKTVPKILNTVGAVCLLVLAVIPESGWSVALACLGVVSSFLVYVVVYLYCSELFPTVIRNSAIGFASMMARVGSMIAPFVVRLKDTAAWLPPILFAIIPLIAVFVTMTLPETKGRELMATIEEGENLGKKQTQPQMKIDSK